MSEHDNALQLQRTLGRMEGKLDHITATLAAHAERFNAHEASDIIWFEKIEQRVAANEKIWWKATGAMSAVMLFAGWVAAYLIRNGF